jgi:DNA-binding CsgD family transcriptional regulator
VQLNEFIETTNSASTPAEVFGLFVQAAGDLGMDRAVYADVTMLPESEIVPQTFVVNYPEDWTNYYFERGYERIDPASKFCAVSSGPFLWEDIPNYVPYSKAEKLCMDQCDEAGLHNGVCIPLWGPFGQHSRVGLASSDPQVDVRPNLDMLYMLTIQFKNAYSRLIEAQLPNSRRVKLTMREREVLSWCFKGKSSWVIGEILDISENAVNFHIKNAMRKLNCSSRLMCVLKAIRLGLIIP